MPTRPKRRGRPPKIKQESITAIAPKRRGRPPKAKVKNLIKDIEKALVANNIEKANETFKVFQKACDEAVSKGLIKKNTADRQKSRLAQKIKNFK